MMKNNAEGSPVCLAPSAPYLYIIRVGAEAQPETARHVLSIVALE